MKQRRSFIALFVLVSAGLSLLTGHVVAVESSELASQTASLELVVIEASTRRALPARVRLRPERPFAADQVELARAGQLATRLAPGRYELIVSHGPHYSLFERTLQLVASDRTQVTAVLAREVDADAYTACDLHVHTSSSNDSATAPDARAASLLAEDIGFAVLSDHNHISATSELTRAGVASLPGAELTSWDPEFGHFNAFPLGALPRYKHTSANELLRALRVRPETFVQINHPRLEHHIGYFELSGFERDDARNDPLPFDGIELWNGYDLAAPGARDALFLDWLSLLARGRRMTATGGSDAHALASAPLVGYPRTYVDVPRGAEHASEGVLAALKRGRVFVSNGPLIELSVERAHPGDTVVLHAHQRALDVRVRVAAPRWMQLSEVELWLGRERVAVIGLPADRSETSVVRRLAIANQRSLVAVVRGTGNMKGLLGDARVRPHAFTNPIWLSRPGAP